MKAVKPWDKYKIKPNASNNSRLKAITHIAHLETAVRILKDGKIRSGLVFDKSKLNKERILVNWLSPNHWHYGSRYGNIEFQFDFESLLKEKNIYWVEAMTKYRPPACRFLITEKDQNHFLTPYDPAIDIGPWIYSHKDETHYWNGEYCLEFMFESDLPLELCEGIDCVSHHSQFCNISPEGCRDKGLQDIKAKRKFFSSIIGNNLPIEQDHFRELRPNGHFKPKDNLQSAVSSILIKTQKKLYSGQITASHEEALPLVQSSLNFIANDNDQGLKAMVSFFLNHAEFEATLIKAVMDKFGISKKEFFD